MVHWKSEMCLCTLPVLVLQVFTLKNIFFLNIYLCPTSPDDDVAL